MTARIVYRPAYFNSVAFANIPESWRVEFSDGSPPVDGDSLDDAMALARRFGAIRILTPTGD